MGASKNASLQKVTKKDPKKDEKKNDKGEKKDKKEKGDKKEKKEKKDKKEDNAEEDISSLGIQNKKEENFSDWYSECITKSEILKKKNTSKVSLPKSPGSQKVVKVKSTPPSQ